MHLLHTRWSQAAPWFRQDADVGGQARRQPCQDADVGGQTRPHSWQDAELRGQTRWHSWKDADVGQKKIKTKQLQLSLTGDIRTADKAHSAKCSSTPASSSATKARTITKTPSAKTASTTAASSSVKKRPAFYVKEAKQSEPYLRMAHAIHETQDMMSKSQTKKPNEYASTQGPSQPCTWSETPRPNTLMSDVFYPRCLRCQLNRFLSVPNGNDSHFCKGFTQADTPAQWAIYFMIVLRVEPERLWKKQRSLHWRVRPDAYEDGTAHGLTSETLNDAYDDRTSTGPSLHDWDCTRRKWLQLESSTCSDKPWNDPKKSELNRTNTIWTF